MPRWAPAFLAFLALPGIVAFTVPAFLLWPEITTRAPRTIGLIPFIAGVFLLGWCVRDFYVAGKGTLAPWDPPKNLVIVGLYRVSRNPMYIAVSLILIGWAVSYRSLTTAPSAVDAPPSCGVRVPLLGHTLLRMLKPKPHFFLALLLSLAFAGAAFAQGISYDARLVAMGGGGGNSPNIARKMVPPATRSEIVIPIPLGLIQTFKGGLDKFKPSSEGFDPLLAVETTGSALYYRFGADTGSTRTEFVNDLVNGTINPDLTVYTGFKIPESYFTEGLMAPQFGKTIKFMKADDRFHGIYIGIGPYLSVRADAAVDPRLADLLGEGIRVFNASMPVSAESHVQVAGALTVGYRGRVPMGSSTGDRDGVYLAYNFHYLKGFKYYRPDLEVRFNTNAAGNLTASTTPFSLVSLEAGTGKGFASDVGVQIVRGNVQFGVGVNGIGNRIDWSDFTQATYTLPSLTAGLEFTKTPGTPPFQEVRVTLPVVKTANVGFEGSGWGVIATATDGYNGKSFSGGLERQVGPFWLRGGGKHARDHWEPTLGFGVGTNKALDVALFSTHANFQDERQWALAASVRIGMGNQ